MGILIGVGDTYPVYAYDTLHDGGFMFQVINMNN
jgi:hypothetical protein